MADRLSPKKSEKRGFAGFNLKKKKTKYLRVFSQKAVSR